MTQYNNIMKEVYAVHVLDMCLDYTDTQLYASKKEARANFEALLSAHHDYIIEVYSDGDDHLYYHSGESDIKILIEKLPIQ